MARQTPSFNAFRPASPLTSRLHSLASKKTDTTCERRLRSALFRIGLRFRKNIVELPGKPDVLFPRQRIAIFCDGDFWHGRDWLRRKEKLLAGTNATYWVEKIESNIARDRKHDRALADREITVLRFWESEIKLDLESVAMSIAERVRGEPGP